MSLFFSSHLFVNFYKHSNWDLHFQKELTFCFRGLNWSVFQCEVLFTPLSRCLAPRWRSALQWYIRNKMGVVESRICDATCFWCRPNDFIWDWIDSIVSAHYLNYLKKTNSLGCCLCWIHTASYSGTVTFELMDGLYAHPER